MARDGIDLSQLDAFTDRLIQSSKAAAKVQRQFLQRQGSRLKRETAAFVELSGIQTRTGNYMRGIKRGKVWKMPNGAQAVRVYSNGPHAHLIEDGHDQIVNPGKGRGNGHGVKPGKGIGRKVGHVDGRKVFARTYKSFAPKYAKYCEEAIDKMIEKI